MNFYFWRGGIYQRIAMVPNAVWLREVVAPEGGRHADSETRRVPRGQFEIESAAIDPVILAGILAARATNEERAER